MSVKNPRILTPRQEKFVIAYLRHGNATRAAKEAGYSQKAASVAGHDLLSNPKIAARVAAPIAKVAARAELSAVRVLEEMRRLAFVDPADFYDAEGNIKPLHEIPPESRAALAGIETVIQNVKAGDGLVDRVHKIKFWNKTHALELLGKHLKLLTDVVQVVDGDKMIERLNRGRDRYAKAKR